MATREAKVVADDFARRMQALGRFLDRVEELHHGGEFPARDLRQAYEGTFLTYYTTLERQLESLFYGLLLSRLRVPGTRINPRVRIGSETIARGIVRGTGRPPDWLPIGITQKRARLFLTGGRPFDRIDTNDRDAFERMLLIRNAIAHKSREAMDAFQDRLVGGGLPPSQREPAGYLRGEHAPDQTRLEYLMAQGAVTLKKLCN